MRVSQISVALCALMAGSPALAESFTECSRGEDVRTIEVLTPGEVGTACDLRYVRDNGAHVSTPYHADNSEGFCAERARELVASLASAGYACADSAPAAREAAAPASEESVAEAALAPAPEPAATAASVAPEPEAAPEKVAAAPATPDASDFDQYAEQKRLAQPAEPAPAFDPDPFANTTAPGATEPVRQAASGGPVALAATDAAMPARGPRPQGSAVGRLVGAAPDPAPAPSAAPDKVEERLPVAAPKAQPAQQPAAQPAAAPAAKPAEKASGPKAILEKITARPSDDIIKNVLLAQAAAWNDGDLDAFMNGYWKSNDLRFVSGSSVTKGWNQTLKHYRERYGAGADFGRLSFDKLDVEMVTDDVAVVVGRFELVRGAALESGTFSLVMRQENGMWRIVHDHTNVDAPSTN